jgi:hypothetical protein
MAMREAKQSVVAATGSSNHNCFEERFSALNVESGLTAAV